MAGPTGPTGVAGRVGPGDLYFKRIFSTTVTDADPGDGFIRLNNATQISATQAFIDLLDTGGADNTFILDTLDDSTNAVKGHLRIEKQSSSDSWLLATLTSITSATDYRKFVISIIGGSSNNPFANNDPVYIIFMRAGDAGAAGPTGPAGIAGSVADGDKGDITVSGSGTVWTVDNDAITYAKIQNVSATDKVLGRSTAGSGDIEEITMTSFGRSLVDDADAATARSTLGAQANDAELSALAGLTSAADKVPYFTGSGTAATTDLTGAGRSLIGLADPNADRVPIWDDSAGVYVLANVGTGLAISATPTLDLDADLATIAGLTATTNNFMVANASAWASRTPAQALVHLGLDADLPTFSVPASTTISAFGATLVDDADAATARTTLGLSNVRSVIVVIGDGVNVIPAGIYSDFDVPTAGAWTRWRILATKYASGTDGTVQIDLWKDTYANFAPTVADTITASAKPNISSQSKNESTTLTGWTTSFSAGDTFRVNVDASPAPARVTLLTLSLWYTVA